MTVQVNVRSAGTYRLEALFEKANKYADLSSTQDLAAGQNTIRLQMTADQLRVELGETGPFRRTDLRLSMVTNSGVEFVDKRESAGASAAWTLGGQGFSVRLGGTATLTAAPLPLPATGYKELSFSIPVTVTKPGECTWQVIVGQRNGDFKQTFDDYLSVGGSMPFSTILRGSIPGWKIRRQQAGGVFEIQFASVNCGGPMERWTGEGLARSEAYRAADFENPVPSFEIAPQSTNPGRLVMPRALLLTSEFFFEVEAIAGFENNLSCTVSPNRPGITAVFDRMPARPIDWPIKILVTVNAQAEVGPNPLTVSCEGRGVTKSAVLNLTVN